MARTVFHNARIFDGERLVTERGSVVIESEQIAGVAPGDWQGVVHGVETALRALAHGGLRA